MTTHTALIVDDEPDIRELLEITLVRMGIATRSPRTWPQHGSYWKRNRPTCA
ncbi:hypothetical protein [Marinobacter sp. AN1]|uniref:hypothetical protein n=1 Tax=Marinobacter sp. AN1 TaxID=2886046 RepID=UPI0039B6F010